MVVTKDCIWNFRNQVVFSGIQVNPQSIQLAVKAVESRTVEHVQSLENAEKYESFKIIQWSPPCCGVIKLNTDDALSNNAVTIVVVARDFKRSCKI
jgi:hypothetical protein